MNRFSKIESKSAFIDALIEHLHLLKENQFQLSRIEKDILLQDLRDAYLLLLSFQPVDEIINREKNEVISEKEEAIEKIEETVMPIEKVEEELIEEVELPVEEGEESMEDYEEPEKEEEEPLEEFEELAEMIEELKEEPRISAQDEANDLEKILNEEKIPEVEPEKRGKFKEPELFPIDDFQPRGLFDPIEEEEGREEGESKKMEEVKNEEVKSIIREDREEFEAVRESKEVREVMEVKEVKVEVRETIVEKVEEKDVISKLSAESDISELIHLEEVKEETQPTQKTVTFSATTTMKKSLNDLLNEQKKEENSLNNRFQNAKVNDLTKSISINDKFLFIRELFSNRGEEFSRAVQTLNGCEDIEKAFEYMEELKKHYLWDSDSPAYLSFCDLVRRKF